jgi:hypothetical protein
MTEPASERGSYVPDAAAPALASAIQNWRGTDESHDFAGLPAPPATLPPEPIAAGAPEADRESEATLREFLDRTVLPFLRAARGSRFRLANPRYSAETFALLQLRVAEAYRGRVAEMQSWCEEKRLMDWQTRLQHWLHAWLFIHVPFSFLLILLTFWHAYVTLFYY